MKTNGHYSNRVENLLWEDAAPGNVRDGTWRSVFLACREWLKKRGLLTHEEIRSEAVMLRVHGERRERRNRRKK